MVVVFDLDDTVYDEISYAASGFQAVSEFLGRTFFLDNKILFDMMMNEMNTHGRGEVFDAVLRSIGKYTKGRVMKCVNIYRLHKPNIELSKAAVDCFNRFENYAKYIVTDGNKLVQSNKVKALGVERYVKRSIVTHRYGKCNAKPSPFCFFKIAEWERVPFDQVVYIGDNPYKDFIGIKPYGFKTIRIINGMFKDICLDKDHEAHVSIHSLNEITIELINNLS